MSSTLSSGLVLSFRDLPRLYISTLTLVRHPCICLLCNRVLLADKFDIAVALFANPFSVNDKSLGWLLIFAISFFSRRRSFKQTCIYSEMFLAQSYYYFVIIIPSTKTHHVGGIRFTLTRARRKGRKIGRNIRQTVWRLLRESPKRSGPVSMQYAKVLAAS